MKNIIKILEARIYKLAWRYGLSLAGTNHGQPVWIGNIFQLNSYFDALERNNLI